jgi:hypothetical protein
MHPTFVSLRLGGRRQNDALDKIQGNCGVRKPIRLSTIYKVFQNIYILKDV